MLEIQMVLYMAMALVFLGVSYHLSKKVSALMMDLYVTSRLLKRVQSDMIDMGYQLYNHSVFYGGHNPGYVYVVKSDTGHYKIGRTNNPDDRRKTFNVKLPVEIEFIVLIKTSNYVELESILHQQYQHKRVNGEWFSLSCNDLLFLANYPGNLIDTYNKFIVGMYEDTPAA